MSLHLMNRLPYLDFTLRTINCFIPLSSQMLDLQPPFPWATWQELRTESKKNSESMLSMMVEAKVSATRLQQFI